MNLEEYKVESARTVSPCFHHRKVPVGTLRGIIGVSTEAGELLDAAKKALSYGIPVDKENIREEIGDIMWYINAILRSENWDMEEILQENIDKLKKRYPEQFTTKHSEMRLDK